MVDAVVAQALTVYRDYVTSGVPSSGPNDPSKADVRALWTALGNVLDAFSSSPGAGFAGFATLAAMNADLNYVANSIGQVFADGTPANDGTYLKLGSSGSGSWSQVSTLTLAGLLIAITAETTRAEAAEATLTANLASEATSRAAADATLTTNLAAEAATRAAADLLLTPLTFFTPAILPSRASMPLEGSAAVWADQGLANGGSFIANSFDAVQALEAQMRAYGVVDEAMYVLPFAGSNQVMARTPLVDRIGNRFPTVISGGGGFTETSGLTGVVLQTGIPPDYVGMMFAGGIGIYSLVDQAGGYVPAVGCASSYSFYGLLPNYSNYAVYSMPGGSGFVEGNLQYEAGDGSFGYTTKGAMFGARDDAARAFIYRNNTQMPVQNANLNTSQYFAPGQRLSGSTPPTTDTVQINSTLSALGMVVICRGDFDANKVIIWSFIMQTLQKNLNRAVIPDGLS
jgi:hypothetical protein